MLVRVWREVNLCILLVGMYIGTAIKENSMEVPWDIKIELLCDSAILLLGIYAQEMKFALLCEAMNVWGNLIVVIISQYIGISNHHIVPFKNHVVQPKYIHFC